MTGRRWLVAGTLAVTLVLGLVSRLNPFLAAGVNNQLESRCSKDPSASWTYDRSAWTPLLWDCTIEHQDGSADSIGPNVL